MQTKNYEVLYALPKVGDTVYVIKSYFDIDGYYMLAIDKEEVLKIEVVFKKDGCYTRVDTRGNYGGTWLGDTFPDEESAKKAIAENSARRYSHE